MPYIPFPPHWPVFTPKDKLGEWFESYARSLELNVWMKTTIKSTSWSDSDRRWTVILERTKRDGSKESRTLHPRHVVQATGHSGKKNFPQMRGMENFKGHLLCHSSEFPGARPSKGKNRKAIVVGCCNSGHVSSPVSSQLLPVCLECLKIQIKLLRQSITSPPPLPTLLLTGTAGHLPNIL